MYFREVAIREINEKDDRRIIVGRASAKSQDRHKTKIRQEELLRVIPTFSHRTLLYMHQMQAPVGTVLDMAPADDGLDIEAEVGRDYEFPIMFSGRMSVNDVWQQVKQKILRGLSIQFEGTEEPDPSGEARAIITPTDLLDVSLVTIPSNRDTLISQARMLRMLGVESCPLCGGHEGNHDPRVLDDDAAVRAALERLKTSPRVDLTAAVTWDSLAKELAACLR